VTVLLATLPTLRLLRGNRLQLMVVGSAQSVNASAVSCIHPIDLLMRSNRTF
jgi:hypothetical protein